MVGLVPSRWDSVRTASVLAGHEKPQNTGEKHICLISYSLHSICELQTVAPNCIFPMLRKHYQEKRGKQRKSSLYELELNDRRLQSTARQSIQARQDEGLASSGGLPLSTPPCLQAKSSGLSFRGRLMDCTVCEPIKGQLINIQPKLIEVEVKLIKSKVKHSEGGKCEFEYL